MELAGVSFLIKLFLIIISIYVFGVSIYWILRSWFRHLILGLSWVIAPLFIVFHIFSVSVPGEAGWGIAYIYIFFAPIGLFSLGVVCANLANLIYKADKNEATQTIGILFVLILPPLIFSWMAFALPKHKSDNKRAYYDNKRMNGVFDFYFAGKKFEFPCHDALFSFYGHSRHGGEDICRLTKDMNSERQIRKKLYIKHRDSGEYHFCEKNGTPERRESAYCQFKRPLEVLTFSVDSTDWSEKLLKRYGVTPDSPTSMIGGLRLIHKSVKQREPMKRRTDGAIVQRRPITKLIFSKGWTNEDKGFQHKAYITCSEGWSYEGTYSCLGKVQISKNLQVDLRYKAPESDIENQLDKKHDEIWSYWLYLDENFRVFPAKD